MANYANLLATIAANIYENHNNEVTAEMVKSAVNAIVSVLGGGYQYRGIATPATTPPLNADARIFYIAGTPGTYTNFNGEVLGIGEVAILSWATAWTKTVLPVPSVDVISAIIGYPAPNNGYLNISGALVSLANYNCTDWIAVQPGDEFYYTGYCGSLGVCVAAYSGATAGSFVTTLLASGNYKQSKITIPAGVSYIRACSKSVYDFLLVKGSWISDLIAPVNTMKRQLDGWNFSSVGYIRASDGVFVGGAGWHSTPFVAVQPGDVIWYKGGIGSVGACIAGYADPDATTFDSVLLAGDANYYDLVSVTIPAGVYYIRASSNDRYSYQLIRDSAIIRISTTNYLVDEYHGRTINWIGDSIVAGDDFDEMVAAYFGMTLNDYGINGSTIASDANDTRNSIALRFGSMADDADVIVVSAGTNDFQYDWTDIGDIDDTTPYTFYGALNVLCEGLVTKYPDKLVFFTTPIKRNQSPYGPYDENTKGLTLQQYGGIIKEVCARYSIPVLDMWAESYLNPSIPAQAVYFDSAGTHPNNAGRKIMARRIRGFMKQLI